MSRILGVGEVQDPPYEGAGDGLEYPHRIRVKWDTQAARSIPTQQKWAFVTIAPVPLEEYERMFSGGAVPIGPGPTVLPPPPVADPKLATMGALLDDRRQLILYGPPGTGKTYTARRLILHWLLSADGHSPAEVLADPQKSGDEWNRLLTLKSGAAAAQLTMVTFHPSYSYEDFVEGYRPVPSQDAGLRLQLEDGVFKRVCAAAANEPTKRFVLLIDEINRGNLPRIFGELITVIEADKRGMPLTLPQSKRPFAVPPNVYIVGTMNTADRSIRVLDAAIRRRFAFCELMPDSTLLSGARFRDLALDDFLDFLNAAIARREGREKQIGHAVFMDADGPVDTIEEFAKRFRYEVIPLLQEYCYEDYRALMEYIGPNLVDVEAQKLNDEAVEEPDALVDAL